MKTLPHVLQLAPSSVDAQRFGKHTAYDSTNTLIFKREQASGSSKDYPPPRNPPKMASRQPSAQPSDKASRPRLVASIPIKSNRKMNTTIPPATYVKIRCGLPFVSATPMNGPARTARMSKRQPHPRSLDAGRLDCSRGLRPVRLATEPVARAARSGSSCACVGGCA